VIGWDLKLFWIRYNWIMTFWSSTSSLVCYVLFPSGRISGSQLPARNRIQNTRYHVEHYILSSSSPILDLAIGLDTLDTNVNETRLSNSHGQFFRAVSSLSCLYHSTIAWQSSRYWVHAIRHLNALCLLAPDIDSPCISWAGYDQQLKKIARTRSELLKFFCLFLFRVWSNYHG
jgi:hypothetical protein